MARKPNPNDVAAQERKAQSDNDKIIQQQVEEATRSDATATPTPTELARDMPEVFGGETQSGDKATGDRKTPLDRQVAGAVGLTADEAHAAANSGETLNEAAKTEGRQIELHDRVLLHTKNPIGGQVTNPAYVIGFTALTGRPNLRLEAIDGAQGRPQEFGGVAQNQPDNDGEPFWTWPDADAKDDA